MVNELMCMNVSGYLCLFVCLFVCVCVFCLSVFVYLCRGCVTGGRLGLVLFLFVSENVCACLYVGGGVKGSCMCGCLGLVVCICVCVYV